MFVCVGGYVVHLALELTDLSAVGHGFKSQPEQDIRVSRQMQCKCVTSPGADLVQDKFCIIHTCTRTFLCQSQIKPVLCPAPCGGPCFQ